MAHFRRYHHHQHHPLPTRHSGVSLIEALVALAVMAFGMLSMVGVQVTLRLNSDVAKQRAEATRIATEEVDSLRLFTRLAPEAGQFAWADIASRDTTVAADDAGNTTYTLARTVRDGAAGAVGGSLIKVVEVKVTWRDRANTLQTVTLDTIVTGVNPAVGGLLTAPAQPSATNQRNGRHFSIPPAAVDLMDEPGKSVFVPPNAVNVTWVFTNLTGALKVCNDARLNCTSAMLVSGYVGFHRPPPTADNGSGTVAANAELPEGPALNLADSPNAMTMLSVQPSGSAVSCYADSYSQVQLATIRRLPYYCSVLVGASGWGGQLNPVVINAAGTVMTAGNLATQYKVCRYTLKNNDYTDNADHPKMYCQPAADTFTLSATCAKTRVKTNLINQNFLVIAGNKTCPTDVAADPAAGDLINSNTLQHQP